MLLFETFYPVRFGYVERLILELRIHLHICRKNVANLSYLMNIIDIIYIILLIYLLIHIIYIKH